LRESGVQKGKAWEEKLVAPLIAAPNGQCATKGEDRREGQKAQLRAMRVTLYVLLKEVFFLQTNWTKSYTSYANRNGFKRKGK
jgi:hypothetical protein